MHTYESEDQRAFPIYLLRTAAILLSLLGIILTIALFSQFSKPTLFGKPGLELSEIIIALLVGFYHLLFAALCYGTSEALAPAKQDSSGFSPSVNAFGWMALIIGAIGAVLILTKTTDLGPFSRYGLYGAAAIAIYNLAFGAVCIGIARVLQVKGAPSAEVIPRERAATTNRNAFSFCPQCKAEYRGVSVCFDCGVELVPREGQVYRSSSRRATTPKEEKQQKSPDFCPNCSVPIYDVTERKCACGYDFELGCCPDEQ
jgi:hypothetical protein